MGTIPTNAASHLLLASHALTNGVQVSFWPLLNNRSYQLLSRAQIGDPNWQTVNATAVPSPDGHGVFTLSVTNSPRSFYRLKVQPTNGAFLAIMAIPKTKSFSPYASEPICGPNRAYVR
jgi:hypothetical protein